MSLFASWKSPCCSKRKKEKWFGNALVPKLIRCQLSSFLCFHCSWVFRRCYSFFFGWFVYAIYLCLCYPSSGSGCLQLQSLASVWLVVCGSVGVFPKEHLSWLSLLYFFSISFCVVCSLHSYVKKKKATYSQFVTETCSAAGIENQQPLWFWWIGFVETLDLSSSKLE